MKGQYGEECNITACQKPNSAFWYNHLNHQYYCESCANRLNNDEFNKRDSLRLLGHEMCTYEDRGDIFRLGHNKTIIVETGSMAEKELEATIKEQELGIILTPAEYKSSIKELVEFKVRETKELLYTLQQEIQNTPASGRENRRQRRKEQRKKK